MRTVPVAPRLAKRAANFKQLMKIGKGTRKTVPRTTTMQAVVLVFSLLGQTAELVPIRPARPAGVGLLEIGAWFPPSALVSLSA